MNVIHWDLKPENILITDDLFVILIDFNCAKVIESSNNNFTANIGTPNYMAPEVLDDSIYKISEMSDLWSLGCVLFFIC